MKNDITDILFKYTTGEATLEETNDALKEAEAGFNLEPGRNEITPDEMALTTVGDTPEEANGFGLLDTGTGSMEKVHVTNGKLDEAINQVNHDGTTNKLKAAGIKSKPFTTEKALEKSQESHIGAVLFERETFTRNGSKKRYRDEEGTLHKRRKIMERATTFGVIIGGYTDDEVEEIFDRFVASLDRGIYIDGNFVPIEIEGADWVDKDDSLLKAQVAVQVMITFNGGVYRDTGFAPLTDVRVTSVEKIT